ncbi:MAG TPA: hypothetical protein VIK78_03000 [Ruminiclostridium sp.]
MNKLFKMVVLALLVILSVQQTAFAVEKEERPPKPSIGVESSNPKLGSSTNIQLVSPLIVSGLLTDWGCTIQNTSGTNLGLNGSSTANTIADLMGLTIYLQKWNGSLWVDINNWTFNDSSTVSINKGVSTTCQSGYYYRTRGVHTAMKGSQTETQNSTSAYIYVS